MPLARKQMLQIEKFAYKYYKNLDEMHGIEHLQRTVKLAIYLARREKADIQVVKLGAMLHQFHNGNIVKRFLGKLELIKI
jgi:HD superfamily phosphodiesterase